MSKLITAVIIGYYLGFKGILDKNTRTNISSLIMKVTCPFLIISSVHGNDTVAKKEVLLIFTIGIMLYICIVLFSHITIKLLPLTLNNKATYECMLIFSNCIFMGIPICQSFLGEGSVFYVSVLHLSYNILFFTYGRYLLTKNQLKKNTFSINEIINVGVLSALIAMFLFFTEIKLPIFVYEPINFIGNVTTPLSMIIVGSSLSEHSLKNILVNKQLYIISFLRLILMPATVFLVLRLIGINNFIVQMASITVGMPVGSLVVMGAEEYKADAKLAAEGTIVTTLLSVITIPLLLHFM